MTEAAVVGGESFPRQQARTRGFSLGAPRTFAVSPDGSLVLFLRSQSAGDPVTCLWALDTGTGRERLVTDPARLGVVGEETDPQRAMRERARERAAGITGYATDRNLTVAAFTLAGQVYLADTLAGGARPVAGAAGAFDARPDPAGQRIAYVRTGAVRVTDLATGEDRELIGPGGTPWLSFGLAEFVAAEEMGRGRGFWWSPDGATLLVARVDETPVTRWHVADPANPGTPAREIAYPAAGTANAAVSLLLVSLDSTTRAVEWGQAEFPYLVAVAWDTGDPLVVVQSRDQRRVRLLAVDPATGATTTLREDSDPQWVDIVPGTPARLASGDIVWVADADGAKRLFTAPPADLGHAKPVTSPAVQVRQVLAVDGDTVLFSASGAEPAETGLWRCDRAGITAVATAPGMHIGRRAGGTTVAASWSLGRPGVTLRVFAHCDPADPRLDFADGAERAAGVCHISSLAEHPALPDGIPDLFSAGPLGIRTALLLPSWHEPGSRKLPVLMAPYGGPHGQRVVASADAYLGARWFAEQGFAVVIADGRGTPGRGPAWERAVAGDLAGPALEDQVDALAGAAERCGDLDLGRVAIHGWSFGGYLAALAVLRRPEVFHAAVAGAPVTDWRLYDTHYTERYLGDPAREGPAYDASSLLADAPLLRRPLLLIHGLADDNVVAAHTLRLSGALLAAGRPHAVLPLPGITHMAAREDVAENLLLLQVDFLRRSLGVTETRPPRV